MGGGIFSTDQISYTGANNVESREFINASKFDECTWILILDQLLLSLGNTFIGVTDNHLGKDDLFQSMIQSRHNKQK